MNKSPDYRDFKPVGSPDTPKEKDFKLQPKAARWWLVEDQELPGAIISQVSNIIKADLGRIDSYNQYARLYGIWVPTFWNGYQISNSTRSTGALRERLTYNLVQSCVDTVTSMVSENKPKPMFLTQAGSSSLQRKAKKLDAFCYGIYYQNNIYKRAPKNFRDSAVWGDGIIHPYNEAGTIKFERVLPYELLCDYLESHYGPESTYSIYRVKNVDRTALCEQFPHAADQIKTMSSTASFISASQPSVGDTVTVVEAHRRQVGAQKGRHAIVTENATLLSEDYEEDFFPYAIQNYCPRLYGFFSQGMAEQLVPSQVEINRTLISIQRSLYLGGTHKIFVKNGSKVIKSHFDNAIGTILEYAGDVPPQYVVPQLVQPEIYHHLSNMIQLGYNLPGVSQMAATSMKSPGVDSGRAMRTEQNINSQRHNTVVDAYNQFFVDLSKIVVSVGRQAYAKGVNMNVNVPGKRFIETIKWKDVSLENDEFSLQIYPVSKLPDDPEGRLSTITEMMQAGIISPDAGARLLDYPDLDAEENLRNASADYLHKILDDIVDSGVYKEPEEDDNLSMAKELVMEYIAQGKLNNLSPTRLQMLRTFNRQIGDLTGGPAPMAQVPGAMPAPQGGAPLANPMPTPTSQLLPNVNTG